METHPLFDMEARSYTRGKSITVRLKPERRQRLELIASQNHWQLSQMVNKMIENFINEYDKRPRPKQTKFEFACD
jgi:hypothetical protein